MSNRNNLSGRGRRVRFPILTPTLIKCPICSGTKCNVCNGTGEYEMESEAYVEVQQPLVVKYVVDNMATVSSEISRLYGKKPEVSTECVTPETEVIRVDSLSGSVWIAHDLKNNSSPKYFYNKTEMEKWLVSER